VEKEFRVKKPGSGHKAKAKKMDKEKQNVQGPGKPPVSRGNHCSGRRKLALLREKEKKRRGLSEAGKRKSPRKEKKQVSTGGV